MSDSGRPPPLLPPLTFAGSERRVGCEGRPLRGGGPRRQRRVAPPRPAPDHGVVVDSVKVRVLLYVPVRSASLAPMSCWNVTATASLDAGAE